MINYVNNSFDKVLKPCDAQQFMTLTQSEQTERLILSHRAGEKNCKAKLSAITYMGVLDEDKYRAYLRQCEEQGGKPLGSRRAEFMRPTGLLMLDFDHVGDARALFATLSASPLMERVALAHVTPSGDGLRLVVQRTMGMTIEQEQHDICKAHDLTFDAVCKDISRLSFAPMLKEILYFNPSLLFGELPDAADYPDGTIFSGVAFRDGVIPSNARDLSESPGEKGLLGETKVSFVATDAHFASAQRGILDFSFSPLGQTL